MLSDIYLKEMEKFKDYPKYSEVIYCSCHNGFAFIVVSNIRERKMREYIKDMELVYEGRKFDVRIALDRKTSQQNILVNRNCKLLIHGLGENITHDHLETYFSQFGEVDKAYVSFCPNTGRNKGFGFVTFKSEEAANLVLNMKFHIIEGVHVLAKKNILKSEKKINNFKANQQQNLNNNNNANMNQQPLFNNNMIPNDMPVNNPYYNNYEQPYQQNQDQYFVQGPPGLPPIQQMPNHHDPYQNYQNSYYPNQEYYPPPQYQGQGYYNPQYNEQQGVPGYYNQTYYGPGPNQYNNMQYSRDPNDYRFNNNPHRGGYY